MWQCNAGWARGVSHVEGGQPHGGGAGDPPQQHVHDSIRPSRLRRDQPKNSCLQKTHTLILMLKFWSQRCALKWVITVLRWFQAFPLHILFNVPLCAAFLREWSTEDKVTEKGPNSNNWTCNFKRHPLQISGQRGEGISHLYNLAIDLWARFTQDAEHTVVNGSVHTACKQHQRLCAQICVQICLRVLCERGPGFQF